MKSAKQLGPGKVKAIGIETVLARFSNVRPASDGQFSARCPVHDDNHNSLSIGIEDDGRVLLHCHADCTFADIVAAVGLTARDLMPQHDLRGSNGNGRQIVATYDYCDRDGKLLYQVVRYSPKDFRQRRPDGNNGWMWKLNGVVRVLYRLPELLTANPATVVYVVEGEKDVNRLASLGLVATCNVGGAGKWRDEYNAALAGRHVAILPDNDEAGRKHAEQVAESITGVVTWVKVVTLPELPPKGDVSDWLDAGGTVETLAALVEAAEPWKHANCTAEPASPLDLWLPAGRTEAANARRLVTKHGAVVHWCDPWSKWLTWDGKRWATDQQCVVEGLGKDIAAGLFSDIARMLPDVKDRALANELLRFAKSTAGAYGIRNMLSMARSEPGIAILPEQLDSHAWLFNCASGVIDLKSGNLLSHDRKYLITKLSPVTYSQLVELECPLWQSTIEKILRGDASLVGFVPRLFGSALVGETVEHILPILWGCGSNGKSLVVETLIEVFGEYADRASSDLLLVNHLDRHPTERADLFGKRLLFAVETDEGRRLSEAIVKELTGGDTVKARRMREDFWSFRPSHNIVLVTNHKPIVRGRDHAIWRRLRLVPFNQTFWDATRGESGPPELQADRELKGKLRTEHGGILRWLVDGCLAWQRQGLGEPVAVRAATAEYRAAEDTLAAFINERCRMAEGCETKAWDLRNVYDEWCRTNGEKPVSSRRLWEYLDDRGVTKSTSNGTWYTGIVINE